MNIILTNAVPIEHFHSHDQQLGNFNYHHYYYYYYYYYYIIIIIIIIIILLDQKKSSDKKRLQLPQDWLGQQYGCRFIVFGKPISLL